MQSRRSSETANFAALQRAAHQILDAEPKILRDPLAVGFVPGSSEAELQANAARWRRPAALRLRSTFVFRSRFVEDELKASLASGVRQFVLIGAGLETFPYRQPDWAAGLRIFEVDHPVTQEFKRRRLAELGIEPPPNTVMCPVDFEETSLQQQLKMAGFSPGIPTLVSALGVTQYLTREANEGLFLHALSLGAGSRLILSFVVPERLAPAEEKDIHVLGSAAAASRGEPWLSCFTADTLGSRLSRLGFTSARFVSPDEAQRRYFDGRTDGLHAATMEQMAVAFV